MPEVLFFFQCKNENKQSYFEIIWEENRIHQKGFFQLKSLWLYHRHLNPHNHRDSEWWRQPTTAGTSASFNDSFGPGLANANSERRKRKGEQLGRATVTPPGCGCRTALLPSETFLWIYTGVNQRRIHCNNTKLFTVLIRKKVKNTRGAVKHLFHITSVFKTLSDSNLAFKRSSESEPGFKFSNPPMFCPFCYKEG